MHDDQGHDDQGHDDYGTEPSWPVALVVGAIVFLVGVVVRVWGWIRAPWDCLRRVFGRAGKPDREPPDPSSP